MSGDWTGIRACVFDAYGTLFDVHSPAARLRDRLGEKAGALSAVWRTKQLEYTWLRSLMRRHADFWQVTGEALDFALADTGLADRVDRDSLMQQYLTLDAYPDAGPALDRLRAGGLSTAILSNGAPEMLAAAVGSAGLDSRLDAVLSVEDAGIYKPDPATYQIAVDRLSVPAGDICFVSTNAWDAAGAASFGMRVAWLNRFGRTPERLPAGPQSTIDGLDALPPLLGLAG
ncbi:MAG: haloacid dehalogenase type II [Inquilinus sp.]|nr:haloacid dehalogenase type II [Inquilinus sp.]